MAASFFFDHAGQWSGGGRAFLSNAEHAARRHPVLAGGPDAIPIIPRNVPARGGRRPGRFVLAPQNAWPWAPRARGPRELALVAGLRVASETYLRRADAVLRISEAIPVRGRRTSPVIHNVLDGGFEEALESSRGTDAPEAEGRLVSIGSGYSYRNVTRLLHGYAQYRAEGGGLDLWVAGPAGTSHTVREVESLAAGIDGVHLRWRPLTRAQAIAALRVSAGVVLPSLVEASPLSALEALAVSPRVVLSDIPGHRGILAGYDEPAGAMFFAPRSTAAVAAALHAVTGGPGASCHDVLKRAEVREHARIDWGDRVASWLSGLDPAGTPTR